ncbi:MAG: hypothetical protein OXB88_05745 [Bacteriovoracales bacterium]|nr:hypothetical protein [Bacteriovoracales bacterium]
MKFLMTLTLFTLSFHVFGVDREKNFQEGPRYGKADHGSRHIGSEAMVCSGRESRPGKSEVKKIDSSKGGLRVLQN